MEIINKQFFTFVFSQELIIKEIKLKQHLMQEKSQDNQPTKYTVISLQNPQHRKKLDEYIKQRGKITLKSSLCRFYLRGICIMKPEYCKFAHSFQQLSIINEEPKYFDINQKEKRKKQFAQKREFNQIPLFILKKVKYSVLYDYQFSERYKKSGLSVHPQEQITKDRSIRIRIRQIMHRQCWDGLIDYLQDKFAGTDFPVSMVSLWYAKVGFDKPQTRCKFGDFLKYMKFVRNYIQVDIIVPPCTFPSIWMINHQKKQTYMQEKVKQIEEIWQMQKNKQIQEKIQKHKDIPAQLNKKFICRYYMAGNCQKKSQQCNYAHSIKQLSQKYSLDQTFHIEYRQMVIPIEMRLNFISLYESTRKYPQYQQYTLQDLNLNSTIRFQLRAKVHKELFIDFMELVEKLVMEKNKNEEKAKFIIPMSELQKYYTAAGFNHTNQNKFQHLESLLWDLGYYAEEISVKDQNTLEKKKITYVSKIPPIQELNQIYCSLIKECFLEEIQKIGQQDQILESSLRRVVYTHHKPNTIPLHVFLRLRKFNFQQAIQQFCPKQLVKKVFFQTGEQNYKKLAELVKKIIKKRKQYILKVDQIECFIKEEHKQSININHFNNMRGMIQNILIDCGKRIYYWPFQANSYVIDKSNISVHKKKMQKIKEENEKIEQNCEQKLTDFVDRITAEQKQVYFKERIIIVDNFQALKYAEKYLKKCKKMGVDLQGRLRKENGFIDLIQVCGLKVGEKDKEILHKQIFIFDFWKINNQIHKNKQIQLQEKGNIKSEQQLTKEAISEQKQQYENEIGYDWAVLLKRMTEFIKQIFQNPSKLKILHDCRQDSVALYQILGVKIQNVFDTSGFDVYLCQKEVYISENPNSYKGGHILKKIYDVKVPGLNTILDKYLAPNGINIFKQSMKKKFGHPQNRPYFQIRPIDPQFLQYSAKDVEDLIEVYENMMEKDEQLNKKGGEQILDYFIGALYSKAW